MSKNKLFTFGDSFTFNKSYTSDDEYIKLYRKEDDLFWPDILANKFNLELFNFGYGSLSNDRIIDTILENHHLINQNDVVIIGKTFYHRFDIPYNNLNKEISKQFTTITPHSHSFNLLIELGFSEKESESIIYFMNLVDDECFVNRTNFRYEFIKNFLFSKKIKKCIFWEVKDLWAKFESIKTATNDKINDNHWSFKGHKDFANYLISNTLYGK